MNSPATPDYLPSLDIVAYCAARGWIELDSLGKTIRTNWLLFEGRAKEVGYDILTCGAERIKQLRYDMRTLAYLLYAVDGTCTPAEDVRILQVKNAEYGGSWCSRGGQGAFMMLARKWDRIEHQVWGTAAAGSLTHAIEVDRRAEGILDDIGDLRRYLVLCLAWHHAAGEK